jgi:hypothetical protein
MADIPRDPRQLARDILAGKVRIEDLARERQQRTGIPSASIPASRVPAKIPLPRPAQPQQPPTVSTRPESRPSPMPQAQPMPRQQTPRPPQRPQPVPQRPQQSRPHVAPPKLTITLPPQPIVSHGASHVAPVMEPQAAPAVTKSTRTSMPLTKLVRSRHALRQGILLSEVLGKPVSLR